MNSANLYSRRVRASQRFQAFVRFVGSLVVHVDEVLYFNAIIIILYYILTLETEITVESDE